jgi:ElaB/YqjD/DUF883 family membrane-anchored ribosome-binding protein
VKEDSMAQESVRNAGDLAAAEANWLVTTAPDAAERAGTYAQEQATLLSKRAQALATAANELLKEYTGRPVEGWSTDIRGYVRAHPLQIVLATIGVGYVLGKIMKR